MVSLGSQVRFLSGGTPKKSEPRFWGGEIPWVSSGEMTQNRISRTNLSVTMEGASNGTRLVPASTVLVVVRGMSLAKEFRVAISMRALTFNQDLKALAPLSTLNPEFLYYYLQSQSDPIRDSASEAAHGTKKLDMPVLDQWPLPLPPLPTQRKIAAILSAYDELIENNRRRIALLERMAEEIYREWFVRLRFPGYEEVKIVKGVPEGWEEGPVKSRVDFLSGYAFKSSSYSSTGQFGIVTIKNVHDGIFEANCNSFLQSVPSNMKRHCYLKSGDVLMSLTGNVGRVCQVYGDMYLLNQRVAKIAPRSNNSRSFYYRFLRQKPIQETAEMISTGVAQQNLSPVKFGRLRYVWPPMSLISEFEKVAGPMDEMQIELHYANTNLAKTRDLLLPRLISGKLSVEDLDIAFPPGMAEEGAETESTTQQELALKTA